MLKPLNSFRLTKKILLCPLAIVLELLITFLLPIPVLIFGFLRWLMPFKPLQKKLTHAIEQIALSWVTINHFILRVLLRLDIEIIGLETISPKKNYFVIANHQSWVDILILEEALYQHTGFSRYFIKKNLMHVPLAGWACRVLYFPYMYRYTKEHFAKHPADKGKDIAITKRVCQKLRGIPFKLNNFPEGTRFTLAKHQRQASPYQHLLKPKSGGIAYAIQALHDQIHSIINMTIIYSEKPNIVQFFLGKMGKITIILEKISLTSDLIGDYENDRAFKAHFQSFISALWDRKDKTITDHLSARK